MHHINFIAGGMLGDFIHSLAVVKNICDRDKTKANIYLTDKIGIYNGDAWKFGCAKAYADLMGIVLMQSFVNKFEILPEGFNETFINLSSWRFGIEEDRRMKGTYYKSWSELLSSYYNYDIPSEYKWIEAGKDEDTIGKVVIHRSSHRHNNSFDWNSLLRINEEFVFLTCSISEWEGFPFKNESIKLRLVSTIKEMTDCINSCKYFIGNQSAPFALASALDVPRLVELDYSACMFYMNETKYSKNIFWHLDRDKNTINDFVELIKNKK